MISLCIKKIVYNMSIFKANIKLAVLNEDTNEVFTFESWNPQEQTVESYLEMRGHKVTEVKF